MNRNNHIEWFDPIAKVLPILYERSLLEVIVILQFFKVKKAENLKKKEAEDAEATLKKAEEAKKITIEEDKSLAEPKRIKILKGESHRDQRVKVFGWVHRLRRQGKLF